MGLFTKFITTCAFLYFLYSYYSFWAITQPPKCKQGQACLVSSLHKYPTAKLIIFASVEKYPTRRGLWNIDYVSDFDYKVPFERPLFLPVTNQTRNNGTLHLHIFVSQVATTWEELKRGSSSVFVTIPVTRYMVPAYQETNLLRNNSDDTRDFYDKPVTHFKKCVSFLMLADNISVPTRAPNEFRKRLRLGENGEYLPIILNNAMIDRVQNLYMLHKDAIKVTVMLKYMPMAYGPFIVYSQVSDAIQIMFSLGFRDRDMDEVKTLISETNLYVLMAVVGISFIHLVFDFLAFRNDVHFWRRRKTLAGLSGKMIIWRAISQCIITLYLFDEGASFLILCPCAIATTIELWKVQKIWLPIDWRRLKLKPRQPPTSKERVTKAFEDECMRYLQFILYPLCISAAIYSLIYQPHRGWYSWILRSLVNAVYAFGFIFMLPQLFINYKLKSVAHLPWKNFMYKAFNTFIDDVFAFIIEVPTAHRLACLRDDFVFIIYIIQRWYYPIDTRREFDEDHED